MGAMTRERIAKLPDDDWRKRDPSFREPKLSENLGSSNGFVQSVRSMAVRLAKSPSRGRSLIRV